MRLRHLLRDEVVYEGPRASDAFAKARAQVFGFTVYDPRTVSVDLPAAGLAPGVEFVQRLRVGPLRLKGPVRVTATWDRKTQDGREAGFTYLALPGHVEVGEATFAVTRQGRTVRLRIESHSAPGRWFVRLGAPMARRVQAGAVRKAFVRMRRHLRPPAPPAAPGSKSLA